MPQPQISTFMYAEATQVHFGLPNQTNAPQQLHVIQPIHILTPQFVPCMYSFSVIFGILGLDTSINHKFRFTFASPNPAENLLIDTGEQILHRQPEPNDLPIEMRGIMMNLDFRNIPFRKDGTYKSEVFVDGSSLGTFPIMVRGKEKL